MQVIITIEERMRRAIEGILAREKSFYSLDDFILRSIQNQINLEEHVSKERYDASGPAVGRPAPASGVVNQKAAAPDMVKGNSTSLDANNVMRLEAPLDLVVPPSSTDDPRKAMPLWGQISRIAPCVFSLRILCNAVKREGKAWIDLAPASKFIAKQAVAARPILDINDDVNERPRGYQFTTGFPKDDYGAHRFTNQYVGYLGYLSDRPQGLLGDLGFVSMRVSEEGTVQIGVTKTGAEFSNLACPLVDSALISDGSPLTALSSEQVGFFVTHLSEVRPGELSLLRFVAKSVSEGSNTPASLLKATELFLKDSGSLPNLTPAIISTMRAGAVSKLVEFGVVSITKDGLMSTYYVNENWKALLGE